MEKQPSERKRIFSYYTYDLGEVSRIYKKLKKLNITETNNLILELGSGAIEMAHNVEDYGLVPSIHNGHFKPIGSPSFGRPDIFHFVRVPA